MTASVEAQSPIDLVIRRIDGTDPFRPDPDAGAAHIQLLRVTPQAYADGQSAPSGANRPSARLVSNVMSAQQGSIPAPQDITDMVWQWGQFLDHDIDLTEPGHPAEPFPIPVPTGDPWFDPFSTGTQEIGLDRSIHEIDGLGVRQQLNEITAWIDGSNVYGSDTTRAAALRNPDGSMKTSAGNLLPYNTFGLPNAALPFQDPTTLFVAGDPRVNEQMGLAAMHTLFVREHNLYVSLLAQLGITGDPAYELARAFVIAELQAITFNEFLPIVLGPNRVPSYNGWRPFVDPGIANEFSTAAYRFGHTMLSPTLLRLDANGNTIPNGDVPLQNAFFAPQLLEQDGIAPVLRGLVTQRPQAIDTFVVDDVRNFLFGPPGSGGFDLASLNIQRGRDHGLASYRVVRRRLGLGRVRRFSHVSSDPAVVSRLQQAYSSVGQIDLWVGVLAEDPLPGALLGRTGVRILRDQFVRLRDGDRFWYERSLPPAMVNFINSRKLSHIIRDNTSAGAEIQENAFLQR